MLCHTGATNPKIISDIFYMYRLTSFNGVTRRNAFRPKYKAPPLLCGARYTSKKRIFIYILSDLLKHIQKYEKSKFVVFCRINIKIHKHERNYEKQNDLLRKGTCCFSPSFLSFSCRMTHYPPNQKKTNCQDSKNKPYKKKTCFIHIHLSVWASVRKKSKDTIQKKKKQLRLSE